MALQYSPKIVQDSLVMCLDASNNKSYPTDLPLKDQLNLWLDAADDTTFSYSSGTTVSQWRDKSGRNNHAIVMAGSPLRSVAINSRKAVSFTSTTAFKCVTGSFSSTATHIVVCRATTSSATYQRVYHGGANSDFYVFIGAFQNSIATFWGSGPNTWFDTNPNSPSTTILNTLRIISAVNNGSTATPYYDGTAMSTKATTNSAAYTGYELNTYSGGAAFQPLIGEVCEIIVFNKQLSLTELKQVHTYLGQKWGISNTDRSIIDLSGFNDNGLLGNGTTANMPLYDYYNKGSFLFDGSNDYIVIPNSSSLKSTSALTVEAWVLISSSMNYYGAIVGKGVSDTNEEYCLLVHYVNNKVYFDVGSGGGPYVDASYTFALNTWYHISATHLRASGSSDIKIYINGSQVSGTVVNPTNAVNDNTDNVTIGSRFTTPTSIWNGKIGSVKIYNRNLSATEILQNYEAQKSKFADTIVQQGLILNLDAGNPYSYAGAGAAWYDVSGNGYVSSLTNTQTYNSDNGGSINFNGSTESVSAGPNSNLFLADMTAEVWIKITAMSGDWVRIIGTGSDPRTFGLWYYVDGRILWQRTGSSAVNPEIFPATPVLTVGSWAHVAATTIGMSHVLYLNGVSIGTNPSAGGPWGNSNTAITIGYAGYHAYSNSNIASARLYTRGLSAAEILQNYNATKGRFGL
jgi:hypothetical protein